MKVHPWRDFRTIETKDGELGDSIDVFFTSTYCLIQSERVLTLRLHTGACDRAMAAAVLRELLELISRGGIDFVGSNEWFIYRSRIKPMLTVDTRISRDPYCKTRLCFSYSTVVRTRRFITRKQAF